MPCLFWMSQYGLSLHNKRDGIERNAYPSKPTVFFNSLTGQLDTHQWDQYILLAEKKA
jgi:hypothetical protein